MKKILRVALYIIVSLALLVLISIPVYINYWRNSSTIETFTEFIESKEISFSEIRWTSDSIGGEKMDKTAFYVPIKIDGIKEDLFMQFDTGTQKTLLYGKTLNELIKSNNSLNVFYNEDSLRYLKSPVLQLADNIFKTDKIRIASAFGTEKIDTSFISIGTMGFDAIVNRTLILDFKNSRLAITEKSSEELDYSLTSIEDVSVDKFPLLIPAKIGDEKMRLFYDTGSSMFSLLTSNKKLKNINNTTIDTLCCIRNWSRQLPVHRRSLNVPVEIGDYSYSNDFVYGCEALDVVDYLPNWFLFGIMGNRMFDGTVLVIDTKNNKFGIQK